MLLAACALVLVGALIDLIARGTHPDAEGSITSRSALPRPYAVAVLPFAAVSSGKDDELIARGAAELVLNRLTDQHELLVIAGNSSFAARAPSESPAQTSQRLGASFVVTGSVQRAGNQVRATADLIDVAQGRLLERHPSLTRLREQPQMQALMGELRAWAANERARVDADRAAKSLPVRVPVAGPDPCDAPRALVAQGHAG